MKNVFQHGNEICSDLSVKKLTSIKLLAGGLGILIGLLTPDEDRKATFWGAIFLLFLAFAPTASENLSFSIRASFGESEDDDLDDNITEVDFSPNEE